MTTYWQYYHKRSRSWVFTTGEPLALYRQAGIPVRQVRQLADGRLEVIEDELPTSS